MYILFAGSTYYPSGGALDIKGIFDNLEKAEQCAESFRESEHHDDWHHELCLWAHIYCLSTQKIVWHRGYECPPENMFFGIKGGQ